MPENAYQIDIAATRALLAEHRPELIILGKSMTCTGSRSARSARR
jgi:glycine/serine hydroxymethyltransferase